MDRTVPVPLVAAVAAGAVALTGCSSRSSPTPSDSMSMSMATGSTNAVGQHNQDDVTFATDMIPHHQQAVQMADMAATKATNAQVKTLADAIKKAQDPEINTMTAWLKNWNAPVPASSMSGMNMGGMNTGEGMMSDTEMANLNKATGAAFVHLWVTMMITHHKGAVAMAKTELANGQYPGAKTLAQSIIASQNAQIEQMQTLLAQVPTS